MSVVPPELTSGALSDVNPNDPMTPALSIGNLTFLDNEHPAELPFGLDQRQSVQETIGGGREVQDLGSQPQDVMWEGTFWDAQASAKVATMKAMQRAAKAVTLTWDDQRYSVLIAKFLPTVMHQGRIKYSITVTVISDLAGTYGKASIASIDSQTQALFSGALTSSASLEALAKQGQVALPDASISKNLNTLGTTLNNAGPLAQAPLSFVSTITSTVGSIEQVLNPYIDLLSAAIAKSSGIIPPALQQAYNYALDISTAINLIKQNAQIGQAPKTLQTGGGTSLFHIAAQVFGDATLATVLRDANGLSSMVLPAGVVTTLKIPPALAQPLA